MSPTHEVMKWNLLYIFVCSSGTAQEALDWVRSDTPAGTENNWQHISNPEKDQHPVACSNGGGKTHYMFTC